MVPFQRPEIDAPEVQFGEDVVDQGVDGIGAIAFVPVITVADEDADLGFAPVIVHVVIGATADVFAGKGLHAEAPPGRRGKVHFAGIVRQVAGKRAGEGQGGIQAGQLGVLLPGIVIPRVRHLLAAQSDLGAGDRFGSDFA